MAGTMSSVAVPGPASSEMQKDAASGPSRSIPVTPSARAVNMAPVNGPRTKSIGFATFMGSFILMVTVRVFSLLKNGLVWPTIRFDNQGSHMVEELEEDDELDDDDELDEDDELDDELDEDELDELDDEDDELEEDELEDDEEDDELEEDELDDDDELEEDELDELEDDECEDEDDELEEDELDELEDDECEDEDDDDEEEEDDDEDELEDEDDDNRMHVVDPSPNVMLPVGHGVHTAEEFAPLSSENVLLPHGVHAVDPRISE